MQAMKRSAIILLVFTISLSAIPAVQAAASNSASLSGVQIFPSDYILNVPIDTMPVQKYSTHWIEGLGTDSKVMVYDGYPINVVDSSVPHVNVTSWGQGDWDSDKYPAPFPDNPKIETSGTDSHLIIVDRDDKYVYEFYHAKKDANGRWSCDGEFRWNLSDYRVLPVGQSSATASGLPEIAGLVKYDELDRGQINHALGMSLRAMNYSTMWPGSGKIRPRNNDNTFPPYSVRMRLKAGVDISGFAPRAKTIATAMKKYGMIFIDTHGSTHAFQFVAAEDSRINWYDANMTDIYTLAATDFEFVDESSLMITPTSGKANISTPTVHANFAANITQGPAPLPVQFTDQSVSAGTTSYNWDVNNDGVVDYTTKNPSHTYQAAGNYTVKLTVTNASGSNSEIKTNYIVVTNPDMIAPSSIIPTTGFPIIALPIALIVGVLGAMLFTKSTKKN